jgi:beta-lactamase regulating signal transducer with metallopeptidase domain
MSNELLAALVRSSLAAAVAILAVAAGRSALRRLAGSRMAYAAWLIVPIASAASLLPARSVVTVISRAPDALPALPGGVVSAARTVPPVPIAHIQVNWPDVALGVWLMGSVLGLAWLLWRQHRFLAEIGPVRRDGQILRACRSTAGPAVVGVFAPRILVPSDFEQRFSPREQGVILAHERNHIAHGDPAINAAVLVWQCLNWFNPLAHVAARMLRLDQEFACDAAVIARFPKARRSYAEAMLKAQTASMALPLGCYWPAGATSALEQRLVLLQAPPPSRRRHALGAGAAALLALLTSLAVWGAQPTRHVILRMSAANASASSSAFVRHAEQVTPAPVPVKTTVADEAAERPQTAADAAAASIPDPPPAPVDASPDAVARRAVSFVNNWVNTWKAPQPPELSHSPVEDGARDPVPHGAGATPDGWLPRLQAGASIEMAVGTMLPSGKFLGQHVTYRQGDTFTAGTMNSDRRYGLVPGARQIGDKVEFHPALYLDGQLIGSGTATIASGETAQVVLDSGQTVTVSAVLHASADGPPRPG